MKPAELAWAAIDHIEANPDTYDGMVWIARHGDLITADFAGRVCLIHGDTPNFGSDSDTHWVRTVDGDVVSIPWRAKALLGIDPYEGGVLPETAAEVEAMFGPRPETARHRAPEPLPPASAPRKGYVVVSQKASRRDVTLCRHRFELLAELCSWRRERKGRSQHDVTGVFYTVYAAVKP